MCFFIFPVKPPFFPAENGKVIFIYSILFVEGILPDKAALVSVFRDHRITQDLSVFIGCIQVEHEDPARIQIIVCQPENLQKILF